MEVTIALSRLKSTEEIPEKTISLHHHLGCPNAMVCITILQISVSIFFTYCSLSNNTDGLCTCFEWDHFVKSMRLFHCVHWLGNHWNRPTLVFLYAQVYVNLQAHTYKGLRQSSKMFCQLLFPNLNTLLNPFFFSLVPSLISLPIHVFQLTSLIFTHL